MSTLKLDPKKTALVVIDLQKGIVGMPTAPYPSAEVIERSNRLARKLREKGGTAVYVHVDMANFLQLSADAPIRDPNAPPPPASASDLVPEAGHQSGDVLITKRHWGAFAGTELEQELRKRGVDTVVHWHRDQYWRGINRQAGNRSGICLCDRGRRMQRPQCG